MRWAPKLSEAEQAKRYEKSYPGAVSDEAQAAARQDRIEFKSRRAEGRRSRYVSVPEMPWKKGPA